MAMHYSSLYSLQFSRFLDLPHARDLAQYVFCTAAEQRVGPIANLTIEFRRSKGSSESPLLDRAVDELLF
jgi:hypothetical protein